VHAHVQSSQDDVLAAGGIRIEANRHLEHGGNLSAQIDLPARGKIDACEHFQKRRLAGAVVAHQADAIAVLDVEGQVVQRVHVDAVRRVAREISLQGDLEQVLFQRPVATLVHRKLD
jgi:hypothetical protein